MKETSKFPPGWDEERVRRVLEHYEQQSDDEALAEDEAAYESTTHTVMKVPIDLVPAVRELLAKRRQADRRMPSHTPGPVLHSGTRHPSALAPRQTEFRLRPASPPPRSPPFQSSPI